jgi:hypothetical protein
MTIVLPSSSRALAVHVLDGSSERDFPLMRRKMLPQRFDKVSDFLSDTFFRNLTHRCEVKFSFGRIYEIYIKCGALYVPNRFLYYYQIWFYFTFVKLRQKVLRTFCFLLYHLRVGAHSPAVNVQSRKELRSFLFHYTAMPKELALSGHPFAGVHTERAKLVHGASSAAPLWVLAVRWSANGI